MPITAKSIPTSVPADNFRALKAKQKETQSGTTRRRGTATPRTPLVPISMDAFYGTAEVLAITGWSNTKLFKKLAEGKFPKPIKDGNRNKWKTSVLRQHLEL